MLSFDVLCEAHRADLAREAAQDRLASRRELPSSWRVTVSRVLHEIADRIEPSYVSPRASRALS
ncbi:MAG: hypothetical protein JOZ87_29205 [Chloroflexi bacterium]|nr:hypothetical protein [Chloroflexota bacterium]